MSDFSGTAAKRLAELEATENPSNEWLRTHLQAALQELARIQPLADIQAERDEDF